MENGRILLRPVGFYEELLHEWACWADSSLRSAAHGSSLSSADRESLAQYVSAAPVFMEAMTYLEDPLAEDPAKSPIGSAIIRGDGVWAWPEALAHLLRRYRVELPDEFVTHAREARFTPPSVSLARGYTLPGLIFEEDE